MQIEAGTIYSGYSRRTWGGRCPTSHRYVLNVRDDGTVTYLQLDRDRAGTIRTIKERSFRAWAVAPFTGSGASSWRILIDNAPSFSQAATVTNQNPDGIDADTGKLSVSLRGQHPPVILVDDLEPGQTVTRNGVSHLVVASPAEPNPAFRKLLVNLDTFETAPPSHTEYFLAKAKLTLTL